jgi:hypothetical protein
MPFLFVVNMLLCCLVGLLRPAGGIWRLIYGAFDLNIGFVMFAKPIILGREDAGVPAGSCRAARTPTFHVLGL